VSVLIEHLKNLYKVDHMDIKKLNHMILVQSILHVTCFLKRNNQNGNSLLFEIFGPLNFDEK